MTVQNIDQTMAKLRKLPPEQIAEVEDFIDFLELRVAEQALTRAAETLSMPVLDKIWNNETDAEYDWL